MFNILVLNAGSSSLKFKVFTTENHNFSVVARGQFSKTNSSNPTFSLKAGGNTINQEFTTALSPAELLQILYREIQNSLNNIQIDVIGHRVVHGGELYTEPTIIDQDVINNLKQIIYLSPIHMPHNIAPMEICQRIFNNIPQVACFDTSFHSTIPKTLRMYAIPRYLTEEAKIKRYGFHGLSYEYLIHQLAESHPELARKRVIIAHLGAGASMCALKDKKSFDTTMGLTPLEGLVMGTRCGSIDPAIVLYLMSQGLDYNEITQLLYFKSGLLGVSESTADFAVLSNTHTQEAEEAYTLFLNSVTKHLLALSASLQGVDAIVFSGGIGENSAKLRRDVLNKISWLGINLDSESNNNNDYSITTTSSPIKAFVIPTQEELVIARYCYTLINT